MYKEPYKDSDWLKEKYHEEELTAEEMADAGGCSRTTIYKYMQENDIPRDRGMGYRVSNPEKYRDSEWLWEKYHGERLSTSEIGELCDCSKQTIKLWLEKHGIEKRSRSEAAKVRMENYPDLAEKLIEAGTETLREHGVNPWEIWSEEEREAFRQRLSEERTGEGNPMWDVTGRDNPGWKEDKPNSQFYQSKAWRGVRESVIERDNHRCQDCGSWSFDKYANAHLEDGIDEKPLDELEELTVHHVIPISDGGPKFDESNLVTLCRSCHQKWEGVNLRPDTQ